MNWNSGLGTEIDTQWYSSTQHLSGKTQNVTESMASTFD